MISLYKFTQKFFIILVNAIIGIQFILSVIIFLTAFYWFFSLIGSNLMAFINPLATEIIKFMHSFYHQQAQIGGQTFDGSLLLFDIICIVIIISLTGLRRYLNRVDDKLKKKIKTLKRKNEEILNRQMEEQALANISEYNNYAIAIELVLQNCMVNNFFGGNETEGILEKQEAAFNDLNKVLNILNNVSVAKTDNKIVILAKDFNTFDRTMFLITNELENIKAKMLKDRWLMNGYIGTVIYKEENLKAIYDELQTLLNLKIKNEIISFGNFNIRYELCWKKLQLETPKFNMTKKGIYHIKDNEVSIWRLVKKI